MLDKTIKQKHHRHQNGHKADHQPGEFIYSLFKTVFNFFIGGKTFSQFSEVSIFTCRHGERQRRSTFNVGAEKAQVFKLQGARLVRRHRIYIFFHRKRLAS